MGGDLEIYLEKSIHILYSCCKLPKLKVDKYFFLVDKYFFGGGSWYYIESQKIKNAGGMQKNGGETLPRHL